MKKRTAGIVVALLLGLALAPAPARAIEEEVSLKIYNLQPYDLLLKSVKVAGCQGEEEFIDPPGDIPFDTLAKISWPGGCDIRLVWSIRYFTGLEITLSYDAETGELVARSRSDEFYPSLMGPRCAEGVCSYQLVIWNAESFWD